MKKEQVSKIQYGIYLEDIKNEKSTLYNLPFLVKLCKNIDIEKFVSALNELIKKRPILSAKLEFNENDGNLYIYSDENDLVQIKRTKANESYIQNEEKLVRKFDFTKEHLSRFEIYETSDGYYYFQDVHHIICDGTTINNIFRDIESAYNGKAIEDEKFDFFSYLAKVKNVDEKKREEDFKFYDNVLNDIDTDNLPLRDMYEEKESESWLSKDFDLNIPNDKKYSNTSIFLTAFTFLLCKFNGTKSTISNMIYRGRDEETNDTLGMFIETMPFTFTYANEDNVKDMLSKNTNYIKELREKNAVTLVDLGDKYRVNNDINFAYQDSITNFALMSDSGNVTKRVYDKNHIEETKLMIEVLKIGEGKYRLHIGYRNDYYSDGFAKSFSNAYIKTLKEFLSKEKFADIDISDDEEVKKLNSFFGKELKYDKNETIVSLINKQIKTYSNRIAIVAKDKKLTYDEFRIESNKFANFLLEKGVKETDTVAIMIDRTEHMPILAFAVSKIGATYIPIDPSYPDDRVNFMIKDGGAKILLTLGKYANKIDKEYKGLVVKVDDNATISTINNDKDIDIKVTADNRFIMLYTSGTTGTPKGVELLHKNLVATIMHINDVRKNDGVVRYAAYASFGFDANMFDMYPTLTEGGVLYIIPDDYRLDLYALRDFYNRNKITHSFMTTQIARQFVELGGQETLVELTTGGEKLASVKPPKFRFLNDYGPTECSMFVTSFTVDRFLKDIPIGKATSNNHVYIVDELNHRLPVGASGELVVAGPQVGKGYLNRPDKNAEAFKTNPFENVAPYDRVYYSGDVVRFLPDGNIQYVGRRDTQVKVRGFRIELSEVEEVIRRFDGIKDAVVVAYDDSAGMKYLVAYVVSNDKINVKKLNEFILKEKPAYMVPSITMQIDAIPYTQNQKVNKRALPQPEYNESGDIKKPTNTTEEKLFDIISSVIGNKNFGIDEDIFMLGLNSISVVRLNVLLGNEFDVSIRIGDIKDNNTIEKLESFISANKSNAHNMVENANEKYAISKTQEGIFVESIANPGTTIYNMTVFLKIDDSINVNKLEEAVKAAIDAHPYMNAVIGMDEKTNDIYAKKNDNTDYNVEICQVKNLPDKNTLVKPFSLLGKCLYRVKIFDTSEDGKYLFLDMHHIIGDGTSLVILLKDIEKAYDGKKLEKEKFTGFSYAEEERRLLKTPAYDKAKKYYEDLLNKADTDAKLPNDETGRTEKKVANITKGLNLDKNIVEKFCNEKNISLNAFFNAVFGFTLSKYNYKEEVTYATIYNGRNDSRMDNAVYMLVKTLPILCRYDKDTKILDFLNGYKDQITNNMYNDLYSFQEISRNQHVNADTMFIYQGDNFNFEKFLGHDSKFIDIESTIAKEPFKIDLNVINNKYVAKSEYRDDLYGSDTVEGFIECMEAVAKEFLSKEKLSEVSLLTDRTRKLIDKFNDTAMPIENVTIDKYFEETVAKYKDRVAVIDKEGPITFDELNKRANRIAHSLIDMGVKRDEYVGLMLNRGANVYAGRIGIWKSGSPFLAIGDKYPDDRITYIIEDSKVKLLITTEEIFEKRKELFDKLGLKILYINDLLKNANDFNPTVDIKQNDLAYCLYTSGSTGKPKGVMIEHHGLVPYATDNEKCIQCHIFTGAGTKMLVSVSAFTFDLSVGEMIVALCNGIGVSIASDDEINNPLLLCDNIIKNQVDGLICTPSFINNMLDIEETHEALRKLKGIKVGAETFPKQLFKKIRENGMNARIINCYGPTETTVYSTASYVDSDEHITIGGPLPNEQVYIFDKYDNMLPPKILGEVVIGGIGVARGYVGREDLNTTRFIKVPGNRLYKTGDLAKWNYEGTLDFLGRMDNQVKLHGLRIELDEISNVINTYGDVKQSIAVVKKNSEGEEYLAAYFIASSKVDIEELNAYIRKYLTDYMIPTTIMQLDAFPTNVNGKVDKGALPDASVETVKREVKKASTELQKTILEMFELALNKKDVGVDDDFFKLGGTSLSASKIAMKAMTLKLPINYGDVFDFPTVASLAKLVSERQGKTEEKVEEDKQDKMITKDNAKDTEEVKKALSHNSMEYIDEVKTTPFGNVVLTGATGFLGIHVLKYLIDNTDKKVYCFVRKGKMSSSIAKLKNYLMYYFDDSYDELFGKRIFIVSGDITDTETIDYLVYHDFDTIINCAACVKHFGVDDTLYNVNVQGVKNLVDFCVKNNKRLIHVSTASVAGVTFEGSEIENVKITETILNFGQDISNKYVNTKFQAEEVILTNITKNNLKAKIVRVGNLMSRYSDGEFQINLSGNAFMRKMKAYYTMKVFPMSQMAWPCEFTPIDCVAETIVRLAGTNDEFTTFISCNTHYVQMGDVIYAMNKAGANIKVVFDEEYNEVFNKYLNDQKKNDAVSILISYDMGENKKVVFVGYDNTFTTNALYRVNFRWPIITEDYIENAISNIIKLGFFDT